MLPSLGGGKTLRGCPDFRFRDRNRLVMNAGAALDSALPRHGGLL